MGSYTAFLDLSLGVTGPALGLVAGWAGLNQVFLASAAVVLCAGAVSVRLILGDEPADDVATMETF